MFHGRGPAWMTTATVDSYVNLQPVTGSSSGGGAKGLWIALVVVAVLAVLAVVLWSLRHGRATVAEEA